MTRAKAITKEAKKFAKEIDDWEIAEDVQDAFEQGAEWADAHPHWVSVKDGLPKDGQHAATINKVGVQDVRHYSHGKWYSNFGNEYDDITHWMPLPQPPKGGEE